MSVLTKVFVVLVTFLSILLVTLIVPFVAKTEDYRAKLETTESAKLRAEAAARNRENEITQLQSGESERFTALQAKNRSLAETITNLTENLAEQKAEVQSLEAEKAKRDADFSRLTAASEQYGQITQSLQKELNQRRNEAVENKTRIIELADRNNDLDSQLDTLTRSVRQFKERNAELEGEKQRLEEGIAKLDPAIQKIALGEGTTTADGDTPFVPATPIAGLVTAVLPLGEDIYIEVDIGQNDGVERNMKFMIHRGGQYLGSTVIVKVDTDQSAGRMVLRVPEAEVTIGDSVLTGDIAGSGSM